MEDNKIKLLDYGKIKPPKNDKHIVERLNAVARELDDLCKKTQPTHIIIEDIVQFMQGRSSAKTIILLAIFNRVTALKCYQVTGITPIFLLPVSIRSKIAKFLKMKRIEKEQIPEALETYFGKKFYTISGYKTKGKNKGKPVVTVFDEADGIACGMAGIIHLGLIKDNNEE